MTDDIQFKSFDDLDVDQDADQIDVDADRPRCRCGGFFVDLLKLPGGRVVADDRVPFSDGPAGVEAFVGCLGCHEPPDDRLNPGGDGSDVDG